MSHEPNPQPDSPGKQAIGAAEDGLTKRSQWSNWTVLAMIILCFFVIVRFKPFHAATAIHGTSAERRLDHLELRPLTGTSQGAELGDLTGRVVVLLFWGVWDSQSRNGLSYLADLDRRFGRSRAFRLLAVSCGRSGKEDLGELDYETRAFLQQANITFPTYADPGGVSRKAVESAIGVQGIPTILVIDRQGRIRHVHNDLSPETARQIERAVERLLDES